MAWRCERGKRDDIAKDEVLELGPEERGPRRERQRLVAVDDSNDIICVLFRSSQEIVGDGHEHRPGAQTQPQRLQARSVVSVAGMKRCIGCERVTLNEASVQSSSQNMARMRLGRVSARGQGACKWQWSGR